MKVKGSCGSNTQFMGTLEQKTLQKQQEKNNTIKRIQQVRLQEATISKNQLNNMQSIKQKQQEEEQRQQQLEQYKKTQELIKLYKEQKEKALLEIGEAHKNALQESINKQENEKKEKLHQQELKKKQKQWQKEAVQWNNKENYEKHGKFEDYVKHQKDVRQNEDQKSKQIVEKYREDLANRQPEEIEQPLNYELYDKNMSKKSYVRSMEYYANTHHHNPMVVKYKEEDTEDARILADIESKITQAQLEKKKAEQEMKQLKQDERGQEAMQKLKDEKVLQAFNKEMESIRLQEQHERIEAGKQNPNTNYKPLSKVSKEVNQEKKLEAEFEKQFLDKKARWENNEIQEEDVVAQHLKENQKKKKQVVPLNNALSQRINKHKQAQENAQKEKSSSQKRKSNSPVKRPSENLIEKQNQAAKIRQQEEQKKQQNNKKTVFIDKALAEQRKLMDKEKAQRELEEKKLIQQQQIMQQQKIEDSDTSVTSDDTNLNINSQINNNNIKNTSGVYKQQWEQQQQQQQQQQIQEEEELTSSESDYYQSQARNNQNQNQQEFTTSQKQQYEDEETSQDEEEKSSFQESSSKDDIKKYIQQQEEFLKQLENDRKKIKEKMQSGEQKLLRNLREDYSDLSSSENSDFQKSNNNNKNFQGMSSASGVKHNNFTSSQSSYQSDMGRQVVHSNVDMNREGQIQVYDFSKKNKQELNKNDLIDDEDSSSVDYNSSSQKPSYQIQQQQFQYQASNQSQDKANQLVDQFLNSHKSSSQQQQLSQSEQFKQKYGLQDQEDITEEESEDNMDGTFRSNEKIKKLVPEHFKGSQNLQSSLENSQSQKFTRSNKHMTQQRGQSPGSELSYSVSDLEHSAEKGGKKQYKIVNVSSKKEENQKVQTAKFGESDNANLLDYKSYDFTQKSPERQNQYENTLGFSSSKKKQMNTYDYSEESSFDQSGNMQPQLSLAEAFQQKKAQLSKKYENNNKSKSLNIKQQQQQNENNNNKTEGKIYAGGRTKEQILEQRKQMMKRPGKSNTISNNRQQQKSPEDNNKPRYMKSFHDPNKLIKEPDQDLMDRLAHGKKADVSKKDYKALTNKNYQLLPEVKKRKEEEQKKEEARLRQQKVKEMDKQLRRKY